MSKATEFGKILRIIRLDNDNETIVEMANKLGISSSYLSCIERGKTNISTKLYDKIVEEYPLSDEMAFCSMKIDFSKKNLSVYDRHLINLFMDKLEHIKPEQKAVIRNILETV